MLEITSLYARSFDLDHIDIFWELQSSLPEHNVRILQYDFQILRSESPGGPWDPISPKFQDQYYFRDITPALLHKWRTLYYILRITDKETNEEKDFGPTAQLPEPDLIALEIHRQEDILFREFSGRKVWLFPARTFGPRCFCYDRVTNRRTRSNCLNCYDVGFLGGFLSPIECFAQLDPAPKALTLGPTGEQHNINCSARLISFPPVKPKDILVEAENKRWKVISVSLTQRLRSVVHQELVLHEIPRGDVEYKLPINIADLKTVKASAERNFTNPHHVDSGDLSDLLAVYGYQPRGTV